MIVRNRAPRDSPTLRLRDGIEAGDVIGPRYARLGPPLSITEGKQTSICCIRSIGALDGCCRRPGAARDESSEAIKYGADGNQGHGPRAASSRRGPDRRGAILLGELQAITAEVTSWPTSRSARARHAIHQGCDPPQGLIQSRRRLIDETESLWPSAPAPTSSLTSTTLLSYSTGYQNRFSSRVD